MQSVCRLRQYIQMRVAKIVVQTSFSTSFVRNNITASRFSLSGIPFPLPFTAGNSAMKLHALFLLLHLLAVVIWVGGMFFAHLCLRPAALEHLQPPQRLPFLHGVYRRFFRWVTVAIVLVILSGFAMLHRSGFATVPPAWQLMMVAGLVMSAIFVSILLGPYQTMGQALAAADIPAAAAAQGQIRQRVLINLILGLLTIVVATIGLAL